LEKPRATGPVGRKISAISSKRQFRQVKNREMGKHRRVMQADARQFVTSL
jgi:hypothetical protein